MVIGPRWLYVAKAVATTVRSTMWLARTRGRPNTAGVRILLYHRVTPDADELAIAPEDFARQMLLLSRAGFSVLDVPQLARALDQGLDPARTIGLSFDDGYQDVADYALPILRGHGFQATVFVATGVTGARARFSWYERQPPLLDWETIRTLDGGGTLRFEAHTVTHPNLLRLDDVAAKREIVESKSELEERLGRPVESFCYPAGLFGQRERRLVAEAGFTSAVSCEPGINTSATDKFALRRRQIDRRDTTLDFRSKVAGGHDTPPSLRGVYRRLRYGAVE
jgi:peptidoglycan/xylan/chitin deacetylase (PgdA/CDA1 family)